MYATNLMIYNLAIWSIWTTEQSVKLGQSPFSSTRCSDCTFHKTIAWPCITQAACQTVFLILDPSLSEALLVPSASIKPRCEPFSLERESGVQLWRKKTLALLTPYWNIKSSTAPSTLTVNHKPEPFVKASKINPAADGELVSGVWSVYCVSVSWLITEND